MGLGTDTDWTGEALRIIGRLRPGCVPEIIDQRPMAADEAWVCVRAGTDECVLGLRARGGSAIDLLYVYLEPALSEQGLTEQGMTEQGLTEGAT